MYTLKKLENPGQHIPPRSEKFKLHRAISYHPALFSPVSCDCSPFTDYSFCCPRACALRLPSLSPAIVFSSYVFSLCLPALCTATFHTYLFLSFFLFVLALFLSEDLPVVRVIAVDPEISV